MYFALFLRAFVYNQHFFSNLIFFLMNSFLCHLVYIKRIVTQFTMLYIYYITTYLFFKKISEDFFSSLVTYLLLHFFFVDITPFLRGTHTTFALFLRLSIFKLLFFVDCFSFFSFYSYTQS